MPRSEQADALFDGSMSPAAARRFVRDSGARFMLFSCVKHADLTRELRPLITSVRHFGCAAVYELRPPGPARGPLAELRTDAAVRAARRQ
jgi:hypothetical protein